MQMHSAVSAVLTQVRKSWSNADRRRSALLLVLVVAAYYLWLTKPGEEDYRIVREPIIASSSIEENVQRDTYSYYLTPHIRPVSRWDLSERGRFKALLSDQKYDVIVIPFQVQRSAFDRATRSYMTAYLANEIRQRSDLRVADPYIVARALGDGQREISSSSIYALARAADANVIIWGHVGTSGEQRVDASPVHTQEEPAGDQTG